MEAYEEAKANQFEHLDEEPDEPVEEGCRQNNKESNAQRTVAYLGCASNEAAINAVEDNELRGSWEPMEVIMDPGAHICIGPPSTGEVAG